MASNWSMPPSSAVPPAMGPSVPACHVRWEIPEFLQWTLAGLFLALSWFLQESALEWCLARSGNHHGRQDSRRQGSSRKNRRRSSSITEALSVLVHRRPRVVCRLIRLPYVPESEAKPSGSTLALPTWCMSFFLGFSSLADTCAASTEKLPKSETEEEVMADGEQIDYNKQQ